MKKFFVLLLLACTGTLAMAQENQADDMKKAQAQMASAQHMLDSIKKTMGTIPALTPEQQKLMQKYMPKGTTVPNANSVVQNYKLPDVSKLQDSIAQNTQKNRMILEQYQAKTNYARSQNLPQKKANVVHLSALPPFDDRAAAAVATQMLPHIIHGLDSTDMTIRPALDKILADPKLSASGTGVMLMATNTSHYAAEYLICKDVIRDAKDCWKLNDLGVVLRNELRYKDCIQVFRYACSFSDSLVAIQVNLGWACSYYGDFDGAKTWFNKALSKSPTLTSALEGLATVAYQQGDRQALFTCLMKEIRGFGGGGPGPSDAFSNLCGSVDNDQTMSDIANAASQPGANTNPADDHTYDNPDGGDGNEEVTENNTSDPPTYPSMGNMFANSVDNDIDDLYHINDFYAAIKKAMAASAANVAAIQGSLTRLHTAPKYDDEGNRTGTYNYERFYILFHKVHEEFEKRCSYIYKQTDEKLDPLIKNITIMDADLIKNWSARRAQCTNDQCLHDADCEYKPKFSGAAATDLGAVSECWSSHFRDLIDACNWYVDASSPWIKRMRQDDWNKYMNAIREDDVRHAVLSMYYKWVPAQASTVAVTGQIIKQLEGMTCTVQVREIAATGPNPQDVPLKKLKTAPDYCNPKSAMKVPFGVGSLTDDCSGWMLQVGTDDANMKIGQVLGKHKEDDTYRAGVSVGFGVESEAKVPGMTGKVGAHVQIGAGYIFDNSGSVTGRYAEGELLVGASGSMGTGNSMADNLIGQQGSLGVSATVTMVAMKGQDWKVTNSSMAAGFKQ